MMLKSLSVSLVYASAAVGKVPRMQLALHLGGAIFPDGARARGSVALRESGFTDFELSDADFRGLCAAAAEGLPDVRASVDTSDRAAQVILHVAHERGSYVLPLTLMSSGFEGPDAPALRRFFTLLLAHAPGLDASIRLDLAGPA